VPAKQSTVLRWETVALWTELSTNASSSERVTKVLTGIEGFDEITGVGGTAVFSSDEGTRCNVTLPEGVGST
jgi:hypothetical protein